MQIFQDHAFDMVLSKQYRNTLEYLVTMAVVQDKSETVEFLGGLLKPLMTESEQDAFRVTLKNARANAKAKAESSETELKAKLANVLSHYPKPDMIIPEDLSIPEGLKRDNGQGNNGPNNPTGKATITNPTSPKPIMPRDGAAVKLPTTPLKSAISL